VSTVQRMLPVRSGGRTRPTDEDGPLHMMPGHCLVERRRSRFQPGTGVDRGAVTAATLST